MGVITNRWQQHKLRQLEQARRPKPAERPVASDPQALDVFMAQQEQARIVDASRPPSISDRLRDRSPWLARLLGVVTTLFAAAFIFVYTQFAVDDSAVYPLVGLLLAAMFLGWILTGLAAAFAENGRLMMLPSLAVFIALGALLYPWY